MAFIDDFKARFPGIDEDTVDLYVPILEDVWPFYYGFGYDGNEEIVLNLVAHLLTVESAAGNTYSREVASKSVGNVSVSYNMASGSYGADYDFFSTTRYGMRYWMLIRPRRGVKFV